MDFSFILSYYTTVLMVIFGHDVFSKILIIFKAKNNEKNTSSEGGLRYE